MPARNRHGKRTRTFTEQARRAQIVTAAITTMAEVGYRHASFAQIAKRAGLSSTSLISYHFASKDELINEVVRTVLADIGRFMAGRMPTPGSAAEASAADALRVYIEASIEFIDTHREQMKAFTDIFINGGFSYDPGSENTVVSPLEGILRAGQDSGEFRDFDPTVMATLIQREIDGLPFLLEIRPGLDVAAYGREVVTVFDLATRAQR
ncbi:MAG: TetR family transcriptional regulator [Actinobacteria bacterium]|nr:TetR family transcriptional regulator [Actinomycetota bacterium]